MTAYKAPCREQGSEAGITVTQATSFKPVAVPGQGRHKLYSEAAQAFTRMREAAAQEGVRLDINSGVDLNFEKMRRRSGAGP